MMFIHIYDKFLVGGNIKKQIIISILATLFGVGITIAFNTDNITGILPLILLIIAINIMGFITSYVARQKKTPVVIASCGIITAIISVILIMVVKNMIF